MYLCISSTATHTHKKINKMKYNGALIDKVSNRKYIGRCNNGHTFVGNLGFVKNQIDDLVKMQNRNSK